MTEGSTSAKAGIGKTFGIVAVLTVLSKVAGLARDMVVASCYGTGIVADAYNYAYMFTGNIFVLFGGLGGPFHSATVTVLGSRKGEAGAGTMITRVFVYTFAGLSLISLLAAALAPSLAGFMAQRYFPSVISRSTDLSCFHPSSVCAVTSFINCATPFQRILYENQFLSQLYIMLPLIVVAGLVGISYGILNVYNKVFWPSLSPAIASLAIIVAVLGFSNPETRLITGIPLAVGTLAGAIGQLLAQLPGTANTDLKYKFDMKPDPGFGEYCAMLWPAIFSTSVGQLIVYVDGFFAAPLGEGAWTAIVNSNRLVQLPLGVLLTAMLVPILPRFTEQASTNRIDDLKDELRRALRFLWFLSLPLTAILLVVPTPIIQLLFQRGNFNAQSTAIVSLALLYLTPQIFFYVARDLITRVFYAFKDSRTPYHVALIAIVVKACLDWFFVTRTNLGVAGLSTASTLITLVNLSLLTYFLKGKIGGLGLTRLIKPVGIMLVASVICAGTVYGAFAAAHPWCYSILEKLQPAIPALTQRTMAFLPLVLSLTIACSAGLALYWMVCVICGLEEPQMLTRRIPLLRRFVPSKKT